MTEITPSLFPTKRDFDYSDIGDWILFGAWDLVIGIL
jgi:hypothetical protein